MDDAFIKTFHNILLTLNAFCGFHAGSRQYDKSARIVPAMNAGGLSFQAAFNFHFSDRGAV
jgi:hypothetical protein